MCPSCGRAQLRFQARHPRVCGCATRGGSSRRQLLSVRQARLAHPSDYTRGYDGGVADAQTALRLHAAAGGPDSAPIFFSVDEDIDLDTWNSVAVEWFRGINSVLGVDRTGIYGHSGRVRGPSETA